MGCRHLVLACLLVGLAVATPQGPRPPHSDGSHQGPLPPPGDNRPLNGGPASSYDYGVATTDVGASSSSFNNEMDTLVQPNQQQSYLYNSEGQKQTSQNQENKLQGQGAYQGSLKPQVEVNSQQTSGIQASNTQHNIANPQLIPASVQPTPAYLQPPPAYLQPTPAYLPGPAYVPPALSHIQTTSPLQFPSSTFNLQPGPAYLQPNQLYLPYQLRQQPYPSIPVPLGQLYKQLGSFPGYGSYIPPYAGMGYLPDMYNHMAMVVTPNDLTPFSARYGGVPVGVGSYGMQQVFGAQAFSPGYSVVPSPGQITHHVQVV